MTRDEWIPRYRRLVKTYNKPENAEQCDAYFEALKSYTEHVIEQAIAQAIAEEKYWPSVADIRVRAQGYIAGRVYTPPTCQRCHGDGWIDAPDQTFGERTYRNVVDRCPQCWQGPRMVRPMEDDAA